MKHQKLTTVTRKDLPDGYQAVQSCHAAIDFIIKFPAEARQWHLESNYLCQLALPNELELEQFAQKAESKGIKVIRFYEPDIDNQLTAICLEPCEATRKITSSIPLMLKAKKEMLEAA